jgi:ankyrin repeat protein
MVELLLENGANSNIHDKQERRPIHWATFVGYAEIIKILDRYGADINCIDKEVIWFYLILTKIN